MTEADQITMFKEVNSLITDRSKLIRLKLTVMECIRQLDEAGYDADFVAADVKHKLMEALQDS